MSETGTESRIGEDVSPFTQVGTALAGLERIALNWFHSLLL